MMEANSPPFRLRKRGQGEPRPEPASVNKKRKQRSTDAVEEVRENSKFARTDQSSRESEGSFAWKNLQLVLSLQDKNKDILEKVDLAFDYVKRSSIREMGDISRGSQVMDTSRTLVFMNNWIQSVLISSEKKMRLEKKNLSLKPLDHFWIIDGQLQFYDAVLDCISLIFSFHGGVANENLDLWILVMDKVLGLILKFVTGLFDGSKLWSFILKLSCYLFEPFAKFLRVHPTRKNGFHNFIDKLLEPLLHLLHVLHSSSCSFNSEWTTNLPELVEEVLAQGLFHPTHVDGFLSLQSTTRYKDSSDVAVKEEKLVNKSYHRHLFDKVEKIVTKKNEFALLGLGDLLHLFVSCVTKHKGISVRGGGSRQSDMSSTSHVSDSSPQSRRVSSNLIPVRHSMDAELRKSIFDFFVQILEYLLADINKYVQSDGEAESALVNVSSVIRSINNLLYSFICDKIYLRTEDTSDGASRNFLGLIYTTVMSFSAKTAHQKTLSVCSDEKSHREILISVRKELIVSVHHLLNIEYEVVGDDLESLWTMILSSVACCYSSKDVLGQPLLSSEILSLGCRLFDLYSELRQVDTSVFALCRAVRHSLSVVGSGEAYVPSCLCSSYSNSLSMLLGSLQFRLSFSNAIKAIPEGQAAGCIRQLSSDIMESLEWMKCGHRLAGLGEMSKSYPHSSDSLQFHFREELLSKVLCEAYTIILDSITVTSGNSYLVGVSLKNLIEIIRSSLSSLVSPQPDNCKELTILVDGLILSKSTGCDNLSMCRILAVFFHLLLSCRSLFELLITLMPPAASKKMSGVIGFTVQCGSDWLGMTGSAGKCFLSWIFQPSVSLLNSSKHMLQRNQSETELKDDADLSSCRKRIRKWRKYVQELTEEAAGLTEFIMGVVSSIVGNQISAPSFDAGIDDTLIRGLHTDDTLNFSIGSLDDSSLPSMLWCIICEHVEFWCPHAAKKDLKNFLTLLIRASLSCINDLDGNFSMHNTSKPGHLNRVIHRIALEFLSNNMSYRHTFVFRYMASRFCRILQKSVSSIFATSEVELSESPDWGEVISTFSDLSDVQIGASSWIKPNMVPTKSCDKQIDVNFATCRCLLNLLKRMPEEHLSSKSSLLYITNILNLERLLVGSLLGWHSSLCSHNPYQTFRLFVTCRRVLRILIAASSKENLNGNQSLITPRLPECSFPLLWFLKSLHTVVGFTREFPEDIAFEAKNANFSLVEHTSNVLQTVSRAQCARAVCSLVSARKLHRERKNLDPSTEESDQSECSVQLVENLDAWQSVLQLAEVLEENLQESLNSFRDASLDMKVECLTEFHDLNKLSSTIACFQGLLWGLASTFDTNTVNSNVRVFSSYNAGFMTRIMSCVDTFMNFTTYVLKAFFLEDEQTLYISACDGSSCAANESLSGHYDGNNDASSEGRPIGITAPSVIKDDLVKCNVTRKSSRAVRGLDSFLTEVQHRKPRLKGSFLIQVFSSEKLMLLFLRQLFLACSAILRLNMQIDLTSLSWSVFPVLVDISQFMLLELSRRKIVHQSVFFWLDSVVKFLEELASYLPQFDPSSSRDFYVNLIGLHLIIGNFLFTRKEAKLASQDTGLRAKKLANQMESCFSLGTSQLHEFKERLRKSFRTYVKKSSELHLLSAVQAIERALVAVQEGLITNYELVCGSSNGGEASGVVAAGIDCLCLLLEFVTVSFYMNLRKGKSSVTSDSISAEEVALMILHHAICDSIHPHLPQLSINYPVAGFVNLASAKYGPKITQYKKTMTSQPANPNTRTMLAVICRKLLMKKIRVEKEVGPRRLNMIKRHIQSLVACLLNIILHLQGPSIFYGCIDSTKAHAGPDSGSVILMCVEVLTKVSAKPSFFQIDACHIAESLRVPGALFQFLLQLQISEASVRVASQIGTSSSSVDRKFSVELYAACCQIVDIDRVARGEFFAWEVEEAVKCASSLRRVCGSRKMSLGNAHSSFCLIILWVYCGLGPGRKGIIREVDEALRPGVYALIDSCSADDLQLLHTVFGVLLILAVIFIFLGLQWYVSYESVVEATEEGMGWLLMAAPLVLLFAVRWLSTLDSPPCWWFSARSPWERRRGSTSGGEGGSPWGVAALILLLLVLVQYQSVFLESWFV
ncbi:UNVERIFIED_CONTAM: hypothetical protein Sradi_4677800 [Sesamum radiatum]|uniref:Nucleolar 27S pre-rRNA processing Urb2/Npa2 C-terminal domain-containing protein n=1 Tax=Sesamum radiatum TaxID=300843 RepID=A0AAW2MV28_SESRA